ncbi:hypothetical protein [Desnuesiella massiliensis]|uniref:hypothetical protein n=1 Tax=Desnuesiella massiliensis TaxID=1650662 RepID=UPI0006E31A1C|nr:hypothetical protein [Desnuesiella massiliensis]
MFMFVIIFIFSLMPLVLFALSFILIINIIHVKLKIGELNTKLLNGTIVVAAFYWILHILLRVGERALDSSDKGEFYLYASARLYYFLPYMLGALVIYMLKNIYLFKQKKGKLNTAIITSVLALAAVLGVYYTPVKNKVDITINDWFGGHKDRGRLGLSIDSRDRIDRLASVIDKHSFRRAPVIRKNESLSSISIAGRNREMQHSIYTVYINEDYKENELYVNGYRYKAVRQEEFAREVLSIFNELMP